MADKKVLGIQEVVKGAGVILTGSIAYNFFSFIYRIIAARYLSVEEFGMLTIAIMVMGLAMFFGKLGLPAGAKRFVSFYMGKKNYGRVKGIILSSYGIVFLASTIMGSIIFIFSGFISAKIFNSPDLANILKVFAFTIPCGSILQLSYQIFLGFKKPHYKALVQTIVDKGFSIVLLLFVIFLGGGLLYVSGAFLGGLAMAALISVLLIYYIARAYKKEGIVFENKELIYFSLPLIFVGVAGVMMKRVDKLILGYFLGPAEVGIYTVAFALSSLLLLSITSMNALYYPIATRYFAQEEDELLARIYESVTRLSFLISFPVFLVFILFSAQIISVLYGGDYSTGAFSTVILSFTFMLVIFLGPSIVSLQVINKTKSLFYIGLVSMAANLILNLIMIPLLMPYGLGMEAAAGSTFVAMFLKHFISLKVVKKSVDINIFQSYYIRYAISGIVALLFFFIIKFIITDINLIAMVVLSLSFAAVYGIFLILLNAFTDEDKMLLKAIEQKMGIKKSIVEKILR